MIVLRYTAPVGISMVSDTRHVTVRNSVLRADVAHPTMMELTDKIKNVS